MEEILHFETGFLFGPRFDQTDVGRTKENPSRYPRWMKLRLLYPYYDFFSVAFVGELKFPRKLSRCQE